MPQKIDLTSSKLSNIGELEIFIEELKKVSDYPTANNE